MFLKGKIVKLGTLTAVFMYMFALSIHTQAQSRTSKTPKKKPPTQTKDKSPIPANDPVTKPATTGMKVSNTSEPKEAQELWDEAKLISKDGKVISAVLLFNAKDMPVAKAWQEATEEYFTAHRMKSKILVGITKGDPQATFYVAGAFALGSDLPFEQDTLKKAGSAQRDAEGRTANAAAVSSPMTPK